MLQHISWHRDRVYYVFKGSASARCLRIGLSGFSVWQMQLGWHHPGACVAVASRVPAALPSSRLLFPILRMTATRIGYQRCIRCSIYRVCHICAGIHAISASFSTEAVVHCTTLLSPIRPTSAICSYALCLLIIDMLQLARSRSEVQVLANAFNNQLALGQMPNAEWQRTHDNEMLVFWATTRTGACWL